MLFPLKFLNCVVFVGRRTGQSYHWGGTGFLVGLPYLSDDEKRHVVLFTADHCLINGTENVMRINRPGGGFEVIDLPASEEWHRYPPNAMTRPEQEVDAVATIIPSE